LAIPKEAWPRYDEDGDEFLDRRELREFLIRPEPHVELLVRMGTSPEASTAVEIRKAPAGEGVSVKTSDTGFVSLILGGVQLEISVNPRPASAESLMLSFAQRFKTVDADGNGYVDRDEAQRNRLFVESFESFDPDGDEKIFENELMPILKTRIATALARTRMTAVDRGQDLFEILDSNRDRRLTQREVLGAAARFGLWDADGDEKLSEGEIPRIHQVVFDRGAPDIPGLIQPMRVNPSNGGGVVSRAGPDWFLKMDRNGDGDVARSEFLGRIPQFETLDRDSDGLIDAGEAEQFPSP
jgi:Ca2+-binding EF-hand superfamily protein